MLGNFGMRRGQLLCARKDRISWHEKMANLPKVHITPLFRTLCRPDDTPRFFNLAAVLAMDALNHGKFARRKRDESNKQILLMLPIVNGSIFLIEYSAGMVVASEIL